ncbi:hypothetical protein [Bradyrhizobium viridifuturi]|uniref:hypothetical protein n=1 Tax=Bradyrhizobium viridifuturi TaxID=1654716 RepID=UPI00067F0236|nr:hypothetical protein [Bradyrhizobium viridifuturi]
MNDKTVRTEELDNVKKATAMMIAALVDTLVGTDSKQAEIFVSNIDKLYARIRNESDDLNALELLTWTRTMITGFSFTEGQGTPLMKQL